MTFIGGKISGGLRAHDNSYVASRKYLNGITRISEIGSQGALCAFLFCLSKKGCLCVCVNIHASEVEGIRGAIFDPPWTGRHKAMFKSSY